MVNMLTFVPIRTQPVSKKGRTPNGDPQNVTDKTPDLVDYQLATAKAFGMTNAEAGRAVMTPNHPTGVSEKTALKRQSIRKPFYDEYVMWVANLRRERSLDIKELTRDTLKQEMEKNIGAS